MFRGLSVSMPLLFRSSVSALFLLSVGCSGEEAAPPPAAPPAEEAQSEEEAAARVIVLGDSLAAGMGLPADQAFPALLAAELAERGAPDIEVINAGVSGDTSAGGLRRLDWLLKQEPDWILLELGGNDMLRGQPVTATEDNLRQIIDRCQEREVDVLLLGMRAAPNLGPDYTEAFDALYPRLAEEEGVPLLPFLLEGVAGTETYNQPDGVHPNAEGQAMIADLVADALAPLLSAGR